MAWARILLTAQCLVTLGCTGFVIIALHREAEYGAMARRQMEAIFAHPAVQWMYCVGQVSCLAFPAGVTYFSVGNMPVRRWLPAVISSAALALVQHMALQIGVPVRY